MTLHHRQHQGRIHLVSRRRLLPQVHQVTRSYPLVLPHSLPAGLRQWVRWFRQEIAIAATDGYDWRSILDSLRPFTTSIWQSLSLVDQQRFLRHVRPYWENHRHRMAPAIAQTIETLKTTGQLYLHSGCIQRLDEDEHGVTVSLRSRGQRTTQWLRVQQVINCTSASTYTATCSNPLIVNLLKMGLVCSDRLNVGIVATPNGAVIGANGTPSTNLYTLRNPMKGCLWETTAIVEIRHQAKAIAETIQHQLIQSFLSH